MVPLSFLRIRGSSELWLFPVAGLSIPVAGFAGRLRFSRISAVVKSGMLVLAEGVLFCGAAAFEAAEVSRVLECAALMGLLSGIPAVVGLLLALSIESVFDICSGSRRIVVVLFLI